MFDGRSGRRSDLAEQPSLTFRLAANGNSLSGMGPVPGFPRRFYHRAIFLQWMTG